MERLLSLYDRTDLDGTGTAVGRRSVSTIGSMTFDGAGPGGMITGLTQDGKTVDSGVPVQVEWYEYGHNAWMVWGMWRQPLAMHTSDGGGDKCECSGCRILWRIKWAEGIIPSDNEVTGWIENMQARRERNIGILLRYLSAPLILLLAIIAFSLLH